MFSFFYNSECKKCYFFVTLYISNNINNNNYNNFDKMLLGQN